MISQTFLRLALLLVASISLLPAAEKNARKVIFFYQAPESLSMDSKASQRAKLDFWVEGKEAMEAVSLYPNTVSFEVTLKPDATAVKLYKENPKEDAETPYLPIAATKLTDAKADYLVFLFPGKEQKLSLKPFKISTDAIPDDAYCILNLSTDELAFRCGKEKKIIKPGKQAIFKTKEGQPEAVRFLFACKKEDRWVQAKSQLVSTRIKAQKLMLVSGPPKALRLRMIELNQPKEGYDLEAQKKFNEPPKHQG